MASSLCPLEQNLTCPVCLDVFNNPVILSCGHSFCKLCLQKSWAKNRNRECPFCRRRSSKEHPPGELALRNTCESYREQKKQRNSESQALLCSLHMENLNLFCVDDEKLVCVQCVSQDHQNHNFCSISKAAGPHKKELQTKLTCLKRKLKIFQKVKNVCDQEAAHIKSQAHQTEKQIKEEFEILYQFLRKEEESRISALRQEEQEKSLRMKIKIEELDNHIKNIVRIIRESEETLRDNTLFLQDFNTTRQRAQYTEPDPKLDSGVLIDVPKHLGNLKYSMWEKMTILCRRFPVVLDPNTANTSLRISADLSRVSVSPSAENSQLPENPERMSGYSGVLGSEGFSSGTHSWVVDVGDNDCWVVGVAEENICRKEDCLATPKNRFWCIWRNHDDIVSGDSKRNITAASPVKRVKVKLMWEKGQVTFLNSDSNTELYTFTHTFTKKIFPYFYNDRNNPVNTLKILSD